MGAKVSESEWFVPDRRGIKLHRRSLSAKMGFESRTVNVVPFVQAAVASVPVELVYECI